VAIASQESQAEKNLPSPQAVTNYLIKKIKHDDKGKATELETNKGDFILGDAKQWVYILPSTTLVLNSFPKLPYAGKRFTALAALQLGPPSVK
jgi:hypothetical protein